MSRSLRIEFCGGQVTGCGAAIGPWPDKRTPDWLETDWLLGQLGDDRSRAQAGYAAFACEGIGQPSVREGLRHRVFLGSDAFVERHRVPSPRSRWLREVPGGRT